MRQQDSPVSRSEISRPAQSNVLLKDIGVGVAESAQIPIAGNDDSFLRWGRRRPRNLARHAANPRRQLLLFEPWKSRLESSKLSKLDDAATHHEAMLRKTLRFMKWIVV